ncbi:adenylylsulfate kinase [Desulfonatronum thiosulfatophilum]|uniref:Adenylylsulfate kinase n=1 Tax=Desulfonatronum thiosulfatophilum TaxID=617002 RepID=A0A1G6DQI6_9BACT|nr:adenylyl-sulfate kinase [Desulfonatronum thiosulfatophilum]SDB47362.1 adenylylsulfate kinase [Desulfonatronum thiosulfatophilum]
MTHPEKQGWALWFVGLPGSGKSSIAKAVLEALRECGAVVTYLEMDARRKAYFPNPTYSAEERARAYELFLQEAEHVVAQGQGVIMDGTAYQAAMRRQARARIRKFAEVYIRCPLEIAIAREQGRPEGLVMAGLYEKALDRQRTGRDHPGLGQVVGVDVPFEEDPQAECVVDSGAVTVAEARDQVLHFFEQWATT